MLDVGAVRMRTRACSSLLVLALLSLMLLLSDTSAVATSSHPVARANYCLTILSQFEIGDVANRLGLDVLRRSSKIRNF